MAVMLLSEDIFSDAGDLAKTVSLPRVVLGLIVEMCLSVLAMFL